jgi:hypothetical protein
MHNEIAVLRDVVSKLSGAEFPYMLTGSFALNYYAQPRMTRDIDIVVALNAGDADKVIALFEHDYYVPRDAVVRGIAKQTLFNIIHNEFIVKVDLIVRKNDEFRRIEFARRKPVEIDEIEVWIVSKEDLIISKLSWALDSHSQFQLSDVKSLLDTGYDAAYVEKWAEKLGLSDLLKECLDG